MRLPIGWYSWRSHAVALAGVLIALVLVLCLQPHGDNDTNIYFHDAQVFWHTSPALHNLPQEYPMLALVPFSLTLLPFRDPSIGFEVGMALLVMVGYLGMIALSAPRHALLYLGYILIGAQVLMLMRFDMVPALCTLGALWAAQRYRSGTAYVLLALGTLIKLYPIALVPLILIAEARLIPMPLIKQRRFWRAYLAPLRGLASYGVIVALGWLVAWRMNPTQVWSVFQYAGQRPAQAESLPATLLWLGTWVGLPAAPQFAFGAFNITGPLAGIVIAVCLMLGGVGGGWLCWRLWRGSLTLPQAFLGCLCLVLATNKVFSTQYLIWALPFVAEVEGVSLLWVAIAALTTVDLALFTPIPLAPPTTVNEIWPYLLVIGIRNALLVWATIRLLARQPTVNPASESEHRTTMGMLERTTARPERELVAGRKDVEKVPRGGIEPPTPSFSVMCSTD